MNKLKLLFNLLLNWNQSIIIIGINPKNKSVKVHLVNIDDRYAINVLRDVADRLSIGVKK